MFEKFNKDLNKQTQSANEVDIKSIDKFDQIVNYHSVIGLIYYGYNSKQSILKRIILICYQISIFAMILNFCTPCLIHTFDCRYKRLTFTEICFRQVWLYFVIRNANSIISCVLFSLKGNVIVLIFISQ